MSRIADIPRREPGNVPADIIQNLTDLLRTPRGTQTLRPAQAAALWESYQVGGLFANILVGGGKTHISALLPIVLGAERPMLLVPGKLVRKTRRHFAEIAKHFRVPSFYRIESYNKLSTRGNADMLERYRPDLIVADEAHKLKRIGKSSCARRVARYMREHPETRFCAMSGSFYKQSILDFAHMLRWSLRDRAPIPTSDDRLAFLAACVDLRTDERPSLDEYRDICYDYGPAAAEGVQGARAAFQARLRDTEGVIVSEKNYLGSTLIIRPRVLPTPKDLETHFENLRQEWIAPDEWDLADARFGVWAVARELALGFYNRHDPRPPEDWRKARRAWCKFVRLVLERSEVFDSELQVWDACQSGQIDAPVWQDWNSIKHTFAPTTVAEWLSDHAIKAAEAWGRSNRGGIVWVEHRAFGERLHDRTGWGYYREEGLEIETGEYVEDAAPTDTIVVSLKANSEGRNLQYTRSKNLYTLPPNGNQDWEQSLGRTHRDGQRAGEVQADYFVACWEHAKAIAQALSEAESDCELFGREQKLQIADLTLPDLRTKTCQGYAWERTATLRE